MIENIGYDLTRDPSLNFRGRRILLQSFIPKGKAPGYYHQTRRGLGYVSTPITSASESEGNYTIITRQAHHRGESDVSIGNIFKELSVNMISISHLEDGDEEMIQSDTDP